MAEVVIIGAVLIMITERNGSMDQIHAVAFHGPRLFHTVTVYRGVISSLYRPFFSASVHTHFSFQPLCLIGIVQSVFLYNLDHLLDHMVMIVPLFHQCLFDLAFILHVNDVDHNRLLLQETITPMHRLDKIIKFIINTQKNLPVAISLEVTAGSG